jgi:hypothetical protein
MARVAYSPIRLQINFPLNSPRFIDRAVAEHYYPLTMSNAELDQARLAYKKAVDEWVDAIRAEEALATPDHSMIAMEKWDEAHFKEHDAHAKVTDAREAYKDGLRTANYGI